MYSLRDAIWQTREYTYSVIVLHVKYTLYVYPIPYFMVSSTFDGLLLSDELLSFLIDCGCGNLYFKVI